MKKLIFAAVLALAVLFSACGNGNAADTSVETSSESTVPPKPEDIRVTFNSEYMSGGEVDDSIFEGKEIIMLNFWEPWCGPCVAEMPALQELSENYADKGFLLIGIYSTEDGAEEVISSKGVSYPIIKYTDDFAVFQTGYVPTTVFVDGEGRYVAGPYVGGGDYEYWSEQLEALYEK